MQNTKIFTAAGFLIILLAAAISFAIGPLQVGQPRRLPVESFPAQIGLWQAGPVQPVDADVQKRLATAHIMERVYTNQQTGQAVDLMLLTATDSEDIHDPRVCFPSQGWELGATRKVRMDGLAVNEFNATQDIDKRTVLYWMTGAYPAEQYANPVIRQAVSLRSRYIGRNRNKSLFVRIMVRSSPQNDEALAQFTASVIPSLEALMQAGLSAKEQKTIAPSQLWQDVSQRPQKRSVGMNPAV